LTGNNKATFGHDNFEWQNMGSIHLEPGEYKLSITANQVDLWLKIREFKMKRQ
jgi:alpha-L-fucosidase